MAHFKFNIDLWIEGNTEEEAEKRMQELFDSEPLDEVELIGWECLCKDISEWNKGTYGQPLTL